MQVGTLKYLDICMNELNLEHEFYFDAVDIIYILKGINLFYESGRGDEFQRQYFDHENRVVHALAYGGFLEDKILMLPPHQAELSDKIKKGLYDAYANINYLEKFWKIDLNYFRDFNYIFAQSKSKFSENEIDDWVSYKGKNLFKAIYFSYKTTWQERLVEIFENNYFRLTDYEKKDIEIYNYDLFNDLMDIVSKKEKRAGRSESNYRDVLALMYLAKKVKQYNKNQSLPIPIYFDSQDFASIIPSSILNEFFSLKENRKGKIKNRKNYVLRDANYFKLFSLLKFNRPFPSEDKKYINFASKHQFIQEIKTSLDEIAFIENILGSKKKLDKEKEQLEKKISTYIDYDFFYTILINIFTEKKTIVDHVFKDISIPPVKEERIGLIKEKIQGILNNLDKEINKITNWSASAFTEIDKRVEALRSLSDELFEKGKGIDVFYDFSLFRFFIPEIYQSTIKTLFGSDGLLSGDSIIYRSAKVSLWNLLFRSVNHERRPSISLTEDELFKLFSSFWILSFYDPIKDVKVDDEILHHSLLMLKGACINRAISELRNENKKADVEDLINAYENILKILTNRSVSCSRDSNGFEYGEIRIALAYLYFHRWLLKDNQFLLERATNDLSRIEFNSDIDNFKAYEYAKEAFEYFDSSTSKENKQRIYALNIYIYYIIDSAPNDYFQSITPLINEFIGLKPKINDWHFRFDDTLARNFHRRSLLVKNKESRLDLAKTALKILEESLDKLKSLHGRDIKEVQSYKLRVQNYISELESADVQLFMGGRL